MGFNIKTWVNPIHLDSTNLNRIEQGIKNSHDVLEITKEEVSNLQNKQAELSNNINSLLKDSPTILNTLNQLDILLKNNDISAILSSADTFLMKTKQVLTEKELDQIYKNLNLNSFLKLTSIKVNDIDVVNGSEVNITLPSIDNTLNSNSKNAIANNVVTKALKDLKASINIPYKLSQLEEDANHQTVTYQDKQRWDSLLNNLDIEETDPTVPSWAKSPIKPFYDYAEILNTPTIPADTLDLTNNAGFITTQETNILVENILSTFKTTEIIPINNKLNSLDSSITTIISSLEGKAPLKHTHEEYSEIDHTHNYADKLHDHDNEYSEIGHTHEYLPLSGGQMTGRISFKDSNALPECTTTEFFLGIDSYNEGGGIKYINKSNAYVGSADCAGYLKGFKKATTAQTWGNQTGTFICGMDDETTGSLAFRRDNPRNGNLSMILDGTVYVNEGNQEVEVKGHTHLIKDIDKTGYYMTHTCIDATSLDENTWYPVTMNIGSTKNIVKIEIINQWNGGQPTWSTHNSKHYSCYKSWQAVGSWWGQAYVNRLIFESSCNWVNVDPVQGLGQITENSIEYVYVRGGGKYNFYVSHGIIPVLHPEGTTQYQRELPLRSDAPGEIKKNVGSVVYTGTSSTKNNNNTISNLRIGFTSGNLYIWNS